MFLNTLKFKLLLLSSVIGVSLYLPKINYQQEEIINANQNQEMLSKSKQNSLNLDFYEQICLLSSFKDN